MCLFKVAGSRALQYSSSVFPRAFSKSVLCAVPGWPWQDDVMSGWIIGATSAAVAVYWVTLPRRQQRIAGGNCARMQAVQRCGTIALMDESGSESESNTPGAVVHGSHDIPGMA